MRRRRAYLADQGPTSHPISQPIRDVAEAASIFDSITYPKGASVLHQLKEYVGEEQFKAGMTAYFAQHAWGNTTLQDLVEALAAASDRDLDAWRVGWLETAGTDRITLDREGDGFVLTARGPGGAPASAGARGRRLPSATATRSAVRRSRVSTSGASARRWSCPRRTSTWSTTTT